MYHLADGYPSHAVRGGDFFTGANQGDIIEDRPFGQTVRKERVVITELDIDFNHPLNPGRVCVGEKSIRHMAHEFGMVDEWRHQTVVAELAAARKQLAAAQERLHRQAGIIETLRYLEPEVTR